MGARVPFRDILFPTDFSRSCEGIANHVVGVAKAAGVRVWLLNVVPRLEEWHGVSDSYFGPFSDAAVAAFEKDRKALETEHLEALRRFQEMHVASVESEISVTSGGVADRIIEFAQEKNVGMIMMPTRAMGRHRQFLLGSVTSKVLHDAPCPVWTCPHPRELDSFRPYRRIVLALDYRNLSIPLLVRASEFAEVFGANLSVFTAIPLGPGVSHRVTQELKRDLTSQLEEHLGDCKVKASICVLEGNPGDVIWDVAEELEKADLIVTGRGRLDERAGHLHSHGFEIIWNAPCPVITL
jgi:nucleotide-binding universal stress UspA family protein